jgi:hypothetical protein
MRAASLLILSPDNKPMVCLCGGVLFRWGALARRRHVGQHRGGSGWLVRAASDPRLWLGLACLVWADGDDQRSCSDAGQDCQEASRWGSVAQGTWEPHQLWPRPSRRSVCVCSKAGPHQVCLRQAGLRRPADLPKRGAGACEIIVHGARAAPLVRCPPSLPLPPPACRSCMRPVPPPGAHGTQEAHTSHLNRWRGYRRMPPTGSARLHPGAAFCISPP